MSSARANRVTMLIIFLQTLQQTKKDTEKAEIIFTSSPASYKMNPLSYIQFWKKPIIYPHLILSGYEFLSHFLSDGKTLLLPAMIS